MFAAGCRDLSYTSCRGLERSGRPRGRAVDARIEFGRPPPRLRGLPPFGRPTTAPSSRRGDTTAPVRVWLCATAQCLCHRAVSLFQSAEGRIHSSGTLDQSAKPRFQRVKARFLSGEPRFQCVVARVHCALGMIRTRERVACCVGRVGCHWGRLACCWARRCWCSAPAVCWWGLVQRCWGRDVRGLGRDFRGLERAEVLQCCSSACVITPMQEVSSSVDRPWSTLRSRREASDWLRSGRFIGFVSCWDGHVI